MAKDPGRSPGAFTVPNCVQVRMNWNLPNGKVVHNVLHGRVAGGFTATSVVAQAVYAALIASASWTAYKPYVNAASSLAGIDLRDMRTLNQPTLPSTGGSTAGTGAAVSLPPAAAICVTLKTALAGQSNRGRVYLPGIDSAADVSATGAILAAPTPRPSTSSRPCKRPWLHRGSPCASRTRPASPIRAQRLARCTRPALPAPWT